MADPAANVRSVRSTSAPHVVTIVPNFVGDGSAQSLYATKRYGIDHVQASDVVFVDPATYAAGRDALPTEVTEPARTQGDHASGHAAGSVALGSPEFAAQVDKQVAPSTLAPRRAGQSIVLPCPLQGIEGVLTGDGLTVRSLSGSEGGGEFSLRATGLGRPFGTDVLARRGCAMLKDGRACFVRPGLIEEFSTSAEGLRQDFVVPRPPPGSGQLVLDLAVEGASISQRGDTVLLTLSSGRETAYHRLHVTDARGQVLPGGMRVAGAGKSGSLAITVDDRAAVYPIRIDPTITDADWVGMGGVPGTNDTVHALAIDGAGNLYAGGLFTVAGGASVSRVAKWDGSAWSPLAAGMNGPVRALAIDGAGNLYAGGDFTTAGGVAVNNVAKWDGNAWSPLGSGMDNTVRAFAFDSTGDVYAGGDSGVAKWDGSAWSPLGSGIGGSAYALAFDGAGNLYVGGLFGMAGGVAANRVAKWDGSAWSPLASGTNGMVYALACDGTGNLYAGGDFTTAGSASVSRVAKWDGSTWAAVGAGTNSYVYALAFDGAGNLYAGGSFTTVGGVLAYRAAKWDGTAWSALASGMNGTVRALALDGAGNLYAGGDFGTAGEETAMNRVAKWDGSAWSPLASGMNGTVRALAFDGAGNLYAGGDFTSAGKEAAGNRVAKWDGSAWSPLATGVGGTVHALAYDSAGNLYAGGDFTTAGEVAAYRVAQWDGSTWSPLASGMDYAVRALAFDAAGNLYAGGDFHRAGGLTASRVAKWNGSTWSRLGSGIGGTVHALACDSAGKLYAGGLFTTAGGVAANNVANWDGNAWSPLGSGMDYEVLALALDDVGNLYAGGNFITAGGVVASRVAKWDGSAWSPLGWETSSTLHSVYALALDGVGNLYAGGNFITAGGVAANRVAKWDGSAWSPLGSGMGPIDSIVYAFALNGAGFLYTGGSFTTAGGKPSAYLAKCEVPFAVTFDLGDYGTHTGGGELLQTVNHGTGATVPNFDVAIGWTFTGWDTAFDNVTSDLTVTAQYTVTTYDVTFKPGLHGVLDGDGPDVLVSVNHGDPVPRAPAVTVAGGWTHVGWNWVDGERSGGPVTITQDWAATALYEETVPTSPAWQISLALDGATPGTLTFGMRADATDDWDAGVDEQSPLPGPGQACLASDDLALSYAADYRALAETGEFLLIVCAQDGVPVAVSWNASGLPEGKFLSIYEVGLDRIAPDRAAAARTLVGNTARNMARTTSVEIPAGERCCFVIRYGDDLVFDLAFELGWNLVSLPIEPTDPQAEAVLGGSAVQSESVLARQAGDYVGVTELHACTGYWVHASEAVVLLVTGTPTGQTSWALLQGWNQRGVEAPCPVPADGRIVGALWWWDALHLRYFPADKSLLPGRGYWINVSEDADVPLPAR